MAFQRPVQKAHVLELVADLLLDPAKCPFAGGDGLL